jgi:hypothetical protein
MVSQLHTLFQTWSNCRSQATCSSSMAHDKNSGLSAKESNRNNLPHAQHVPEHLCCPVHVCVWLTNVHKVPIFSESGHPWFIYCQMDEDYVWMINWEGSGHDPLHHSLQRVTNFFRDSNPWAWTLLPLSSACVLISLARYHLAISASVMKKILSMHMTLEVLTALNTRSVALCVLWYQCSWETWNLLHTSL